MLRIRLKLFYVAGLGLEPRLTVPETAVLPLDDPAILFYILPLNLPAQASDSAIFLNLYNTPIIIDYQQFFSM